MYIRALVHYHPDGVLPNSLFEKQLQTTSEWIETNVGIAERRFLNDYTGQFPTQELAKRVVAKLLSTPDFKSEEIDYIIGCGSLDDLQFPTTANMICLQLDREVPSIQLKSACASVAYAIQIATSLLSTLQLKNILIVNSEPFTSHVDYGDRTSAILFGDCSTAFIVSADTGEFEIRDVEVGSKGLELVSAKRVSETSHWTVKDFVEGRLPEGVPEKNRRKDSEIRKFEQSGKSVRAFVEETMPVKIRAFIERNNSSPLNLNYIILHQSNMSMMNNLLKSLEIDQSKHLSNIQKYGNTSSAGSISVLSEYKDTFKTGDTILVAVFGAGMSWGNILLRKV